MRIEVKVVKLDGEELKEPYLLRSYLRIRQLPT
jgi:hypothetical protein